MLRIVLLVLLVLLLLGSFPTWPYSTGWGYGPSGGGWINTHNTNCSHCVKETMTWQECGDGLTL